MWLFPFLACLFLASAIPACAGTCTFGFPRGVFPLDGTDLKLPDGDLTPLARVVGEAEVVGLGESLHASGGYHRVIARVVRFLVEKKGFRLFTFESPWKGAEAVARYVQTGEGTSKHALQGLIPQFRSREIADLVEWLRERNRKHPQDPVRVAGFDVQQFGFGLQPDGHDATALSGFLAKLSPAEVSSVQPGLVQCGAPRKDGWPGPLSPEEYARCLRALDAVETLLDRESFVSRSSRRERELAAISATVLRHWAWFAFHRDNEFERNSHRDAGLARVLARLRSLEAPGARAVLWAHNAHVTRKGETFAPFARTSLGSFLSETHGVRYRALGTVAYRIEKAAWWTGEGEPYRPGLGSVEALLEALNKPALFVDLSDSELLRKGEPYEVNFVRVVPGAHFDGLLFLAHSPPPSEL